MKKHKKEKSFVDYICAISLKLRIREAHFLNVEEESLKNDQDLTH